jgi:hypothetical protein
MSALVRQRADVSRFSESSGKLAANRRPICLMVEFPKVSLCHHLSSRDHAGLQASVPKG